MTVISIVMATFSALGALDLLFGNRFGLGKEFEKGLKTFGELALAMIGMIVIAPSIAHFLFPALSALARILPFEPSVVAGSLFANDMGGASLALGFASDAELGYYNGLVVGAMMGATVSFTLPYVFTNVPQEKYKSVLSGLLCGICTVPLGCVVSGLLAGIGVLTVLWDLIPLFLFSALLVLGLLKFPNGCVKVFRAVGIFVKALVTVGLIIGLVEFLTGWDFVPYTAPIEEGATIVFNVVAVLTGAFPLVYLLSKLLNKPLKKLGDGMGINETSALGFLSTLASSVTTFKNMKEMDDRGALLNSAFAVSAAFTFADHLAFTLSFQSSYLLAVIVGKLLSGFTALLLAWLLFCRKGKMETQKDE